MLNTARAIIDLDALRHNFALVRSLCPECRIVALVKADAYGHGLLPVARALAQAEGLAVARLAEALTLRQAGIGQRLLLLGSLLDDDDLARCAAQRIDITVHDVETAGRVARYRGQPLNVWLKLDSGMHRLGLDHAAFQAADRQLRGSPGVAEIIHMTHFASAEALDIPITEEQLGRLRLASGDSGALLSCANSAAIIARHDTRCGWVRPGIMLYGDNPVAESHPLPLRAVMSLRARVMSVRELATGEAVGYNGRWRAPRPSRIASIGIGYGDGYPRHAPDGTPVWLNGQRVPLAGRVSMDTITVDVTDLPPVAPGDEAVLWGEELPAATVAEHAGTISYELFTSVTSRVAREYLFDA